MSRTTHRRNHLLAVVAAGLSATLLSMSAAHADAAAYMKLVYGVGGPVSPTGGPLKDAGPGTEQSTASFIEKNGKTYVVTIWMSSDVAATDRNWQCKCNSVEITADGPSVVVTNKQLTSGHSERPCNHPASASDGTHVVWAYGSDTNTPQQNVATYAGALDEKCNTVVAPVRVSDDDNKNEGAPDMAWNAGGTFSSGYLSGGETTYAIGLSFDGNKITRTYKTAVVNPANIGRPTIVAPSATRTLLCAAKGDQRPPEDGVDCAMLDTSGKILWNKILAASDPGNHIYYNQPTLALMDFGRVAVNVQESDGNGKNSDNMGTNLSHLYVITPTDTSYEVNDMQMGMSPIGYDKHASICSGKYGTSGTSSIIVMGSSPTGVGLPSMQMVSFSSATGLAADKSLDYWQIGSYGDSGYLSNIYGENPNDQGRDFMRCRGDLKNPGYGKKGGFLENAKTLIVSTNSGRVPGEPKNALWLSFIPGETTMAASTPPGQPIDVTDGWVPPPTGTGSGSASTGSGNPGATGSSSGGEGGNGDNPTGGFQTESGGCACSTPGSRDNSGSGLLGFALLGLGLWVGSRRRGEEG